MPVYDLRAEEAPKRLSGEILVELQNDFAYDSDDRDAEVNTLYTTIEADLALALTERLSLQTYLVFEPVQATDPGDDTMFDNEGLYAEEIKLVYNGDDYTLFAGKYDPAFGTAWDLAPGVYGVDFAEDYMLTERIGAGGSYTISTETTGDHTLTAGAFVLDTSLLSDSAFTRRGNIDRRDGGVSNTQDLASYTVTLDSRNLGGITELNTHVGYLHQKAGDADTGFDDEQGYVLGVNYTLPLSETVSATALAEWAGFRNAGGTADDVDYLTTALSFHIYDNWNAALSYTSRDTSVGGAPDIDDHLFQISGGYTFENGISADIAYRASEEGGVDTDMIGGLIAYTYAF